jgi:hypothetical protein
VSELYASSGQELLILRTKYMLMILFRLGILYI